MPEPTWFFPPNNGGLAAGFNDSSIDTFKGRRVFGLVRETIQNSLDARVDDSKPVTVEFRLATVKASEVSAVGELAGSLKAAKSMAERQSLPEAVSFYDSALEKLKKAKEIEFLCVHDSNTTGLTGPIDGPSGPWYALIKGSGLTQKAGKSSLGSFGHGSKAPFACSSLRTVFYLSAIVSESKKSSLSWRFQGKSILQTHEGRGRKLTQGTGYYGDLDECRALVGGKIPAWAKRLRPSSLTGTGTSLLIPFPTVKSTNLGAVAITAIANFFYAIRIGKLEVQVGDLCRLTRHNIEEKFGEFRHQVDSFSDELDRELVQEAFFAIETVVNPEFHHEQQLPGFGRIDWFLRTGGVIEGRTVSVARGNGMLITRRAPGLNRFPNMRPFDCFVCVTGDGSELLRSIENPEHNNFEFDRIDDAKRRREAQLKYQSFTQALREILRRHAEYTSDDESVVDELQELFADISADSTDASTGSERGTRLVVATGTASTRPRPKSQPDASGVEGADGQTASRGQQGGDGQTTSVGGDIPDSAGASTTDSGDQDSVMSPLGPPVELSNLRVRTPEPSSSSGSIFFDGAFSGKALVSLYKSGEIGKEPLSLRINGAVVQSIPVVLTRGKRQRIDVEFVDAIVDFAIEGEARANEG